MALRPLVNPPDLLAHTGFMLAEEDSLKEYLTGITIPDVHGGDPIEVGVWYRWPTGERQIQYPFITIDALAAEPEYSLFQSDHWIPADEMYQPSVSPSLPEPPGGWQLQGWRLRNFLPFKLMYQVSYHARSNLHDRYLRSIFTTDVFPQRPFWLGVDADNTWRRTEVVGYANMDRSETTESGTKRMFRKNYTISMLAEVPQERLLDQYFYKVFHMYLSVQDRQFVEEYLQVHHTGQEVLTG